MMVQHDNSTRWWLWPACFLFFLLLVFPMAVNFLYLKAALFAFLLILALIQGVTRLHLHPKIVAGTVLLSATGLFFGLRGLVLGAPGVVKCMQVYVAWPLVYLALLSGIKQIRIFQALEKTLLYSTAFIACFLLVYIPSQLHLIPEIPGTTLLFNRSELEGGYFLSATFREGHVELGFPGLFPCAFLVPFIVAALIDRWRNPSAVWGQKWPLIGVLLLILPVAFLSGRRALQLVIILAPFITLVFGLFCPRLEKLRLINSFARTMVVLVVLLALSFTILSSAQLITAQGIVDRFSAGFDFSASNQSDSAVGRIDQHLTLLDGWEQAPFIGHGLGATANRSIRYAEMPWVYELSYDYLLFQTGLVGFMIYACGVIWIYWSGIKIIKTGGEACRFMLPTLVGLTGILIAHGTNDYFVRFDGLWVIFLPLAVINHWLLETKQNGSSTG